MTTSCSSRSLLAVSFALLFLPMSGARASDRPGPSAPSLRVTTSIEAIELYQVDKRLRTTACRPGCVTLRTEVPVAAPSWIMDVHDVEQMTVSDDGTLVATHAHGEITVWDVVKGGYKAQVRASDPPRALSLSPSAALVASCYSVWNVTTGDLEWGVRSGRISGPWRPDGKLVVHDVADLRAGAPDLDPTVHATSMPVRVHDPLNGDVASEFPAGWNGRGYRRLVNLHDFSSGGGLLATAGHDARPDKGVEERPSIRVWDGTTDRTFEDAGDDGEYLALSLVESTGRLAAVRLAPGGSGRVTSWDLGTGRIVARSPEYWAALWQPRFFSGGEYLVARNRGEHILVWQVGTGKVTACLRSEKRSFVNLVAASRKAKVVATADSKHVYVYDLEPLRDR